VKGAIGNWRIGDREFKGSRTLDSINTETPNSDRESGITTVKC
jgi:hypothetical protein